MKMDYISYMAKKDKDLNTAISKAEQKLRSGELTLSQFTRQTGRLQKAYFKEMKKARMVMGI